MSKSYKDEQKEVKIMDLKNYSTGVQHIGIPTNDIDKTVEFYHKLGFETAFETVNEEANEKVVFLKLGTLVVETYENHAAKMEHGAIDHVALDVKDIEEICPRVIMVNHGSIVIDTSLSEIKAKVSEQKISVTFAEQPKLIPVLEGCKLVSQEGDTFIFQMDSLKCSFTDFFAAVGSKNGIENISVQNIDIDEIVRKMYAEDVQ